MKVAKARAVALEWTEVDRVPRYFEGKMDSFS